ncbi:hypothetical protein P3L10_028657 [Capsicum annuum]|uniref:uncharacterized protein LOC107843482 n=1 Tax=Capsicum annuum TaxID=4072 RepID=UPI0007BF8456|nr:uncharacterized protein LOC107843482 [Capsicum annuum]XP_016543279.1 uncharacterized protein LOC107843482 [Capsicum annuum]XP_016543280.1 uncharacterized protein LOC107843482 [Capsicum annuum]
MSGDNKRAPATHTIQNSKRPCLSATNAEIKFRRRKRYNEISPTKKEELLLQRRTRELDSRRRLAQICAPNYSTTSTSSASNSTFQQNRLLIIRDVCVTATQATTSEVNISPDTSAKGKSLLQPFCIFETVKYFASLRSSLAPGVDAWAISLKQMISIVVLMDKKRWHYKACCTAFISSIFYLYS